MGIDNWFDKGQVAEIRRLNKLGYNDTNISETMGILVHKVNRYRKGVGLPRNPIGTAMSSSKKRATMHESMRRDTGSLMNYRNAAHVKYAMKVGWPGYKLGEALILHVLQGGEGGLETPEIIRRVNRKKKTEGWKPELNIRMFYWYASSLKGKGLVERIYPRGKNWRKGSRVYCLTDLAYNVMQGEDSSSGEVNDASSLVEELDKDLFYRKDYSGEEVARGEFDDSLLISIDPSDLNP